MRKYLPNVPVPASLRTLEQATGDVPTQIQTLKSVIKEMAQEAYRERLRQATAINSAAGESAGYRTVSDDDFVSSTDRTVGTDTTANAVNLTLPLISEYPGQTFCFLVVAGANVLTVLPRGSDTINGGASIAVTVPQWIQADSITNNWVLV